MTFRVILDEQIAPRVAEALQNVELPVEHVGTVPGLGLESEDLVILAHCDATGDVLITVDHKMATRPQEKEAIREAGVGAFIIRSGRETDLLPREILNLILNRWEQIEAICASPRPFLKRLQPGQAIMDYDSKKQRRKGASGKKKRKKKHKKKKAR